MKKKTFLMFLLAIVLCITATSPVSFAAGENEAEYNVAYEWDTVALGGGGYVTGLVIHPTEPNLVYARTDVGGAYRWDQENNRWWPLTDMFSNWERNLYGIDGIAIDPNNPDIVYICAGKYNYETGIGWGMYDASKATYPHPCDVMKSTDRGTTWVSTNLGQSFNGNGNNRDAGEPIMVDPNNSDYVYVVARNNRVYRSKNQAATWEELGSFPYITNWDEPTGQYGEDCPQGQARSILIDSASVQNGISQTLYIGVAGVGVYVTNDAGATWELIYNSPQRPRRMALTNDGSKLYVAGESGVYIYNVAADKWESVKPGGDGDYTGMAVDPTNNDIVYCVRSSDASGYVYRGHVYQSKDGGKTWVDKYDTSDVHFTVSWYPWTNFAAATACLVVNPLKPEQIWLCDWYGVWKTNNIEEEGMQLWINDIRGIEEMCAFTIICPPKGAPLLAGYADNDGARWASDIHEYPNNISNGIYAQDTTGLDFCESDPNLMVRASGNREWGGGHWGYSIDNGISWRYFPSFPSENGLTKLGGKIAISSEKDASGVASIVAVPVKSEAYYSKDMGETWGVCEGLPSGMVSDLWNWRFNLVSDRNEKDIFYCHDGGNFYMSRDGGATFTVVNSSLPGEWQSMMESAPGMKGVVWIALCGNGLYATNDYGNSFERIEGVDYARLLTFGKNAPGKNNPTAYVYGIVNGVDGIFRSVDMGKTWVRINDNQHKVGNEPCTMRGDRQTFGVVYIGTNGRGYYYGKPVNANELLDVEKNAVVTVAPVVDLEELEKNKVKVYVNGERIQFDVEPQIINDVTFVPVRKLLESIGCTVDWNNTSGYAIVTKDEDVLFIMPGSSTAIRNGENVDLGVAAFVENDRTLIPLRAFSELYGANVTWDGSTKSIYITTAE